MTGTRWAAARSAAAALLVRRRNETVSREHTPHAGARPWLTAPDTISGINSAVDVSAGTAVGITAIATDAVTCAVGLVTEQVDVQKVDAKAAPAGAAVATDAAVAASAAAVMAASVTAVATAAIPAATGVEQGQDGTGREQLHLLAVNLGKAECVSHQILLREPGAPALAHLIDGSVDSANRNHGWKEIA
jgi:hypothetical protein